MSRMQQEDVGDKKDENKGDEAIDDPHGVKIARTLLIIISWICMGMYSEITGPTLQNLMDRVSSNYEEISRALVARSVGFFAGSLIAGILVQRWGRLIDIWMGLALLLAAIATACAPFSRNLALLGTFFCLDGTAKGILAVGGNSYILILWKEKAAMPTQALHFAFGIGAMTVPQICRAFLPHDDENLTTVSPDLSTTVSTVKELGFDIEIPYLIVAIIVFLSSLSFIPLFVCFRPKVYVERQHGESCGQAFLNMVKPESCYTGSKALGIPFIVLTLIFFALPVGAERAYGKFIFSFSRDEMDFSSDDAASLETVFWACFTSGRGLATLAAPWVPPAILLIIELVVHIISTTLLSIFANRSTLVLWICSGLFGSCMAPLFPTCMTWVNTVMDMTAVLTSFSFIATSLGAMTFSWISGALFEYYGPMSLMYFMSSYAVFVVILFVILYIMSRFMKNSERTSYDVEDEDDIRMEKTQNGMFKLSTSEPDVKLEFTK